MSEFNERIDSLDAHQLYIDVHNDGGATWDTLERKHVALKRGYIVSQDGGVILECDPLANYTDWVDHYRRLSLECLRANASNGNGKQAYLGAWIDERKLYLDVSFVFALKRDAIRFGRRNNQQSIYDVRHDRLIWLDRENE